MASTFPTALDTIPNSPTTEKLGESAPTHSEMHDLLRDAIAALELTIGITGSIDPAAITKRLTDLETLRGIRTTPLRVATFGDSTANTGSTTHDVQNIVSAFPGSGFTQFATSITSFSLPAYYPLAYLVANGGISGQTTTQMLARDSAATSSTRKAIKDILDLRPDVILLRGGSINDLASVTSATLAATVTATFGRHVQIIERLRNSGVVVIDSGILGYSAATYPEPATTRTAIQQLNALYKAYADSTPGVYFINYDGVLRGADGNFLSGMSGDGIHAEGKGSLVVAAQEAAVLTKLFGPSYGPRYGGTNLVTDPLMVTTTGQGYGTAWSQLTISATNATRQNAAVSVIDERIYQVCEVVPTAGSNLIQFIINTDAIHTAIAANDVYGAEIDVYIKNIDTATIDTLSLYSRFKLAKTAAGTLYFEANTSGNYVLAPGEVVKIKLITHPFTCQEAAAALASSYFSVVVNETGTLKYKVGISAPRIVKLGQSVLYT